MLTEQVVPHLCAPIHLRVGVEPDCAHGLPRLPQLGDDPEVGGEARLEVGLVHPLRLGEGLDVGIGTVEVCLAPAEQLEYEGDVGRCRGAQCEARRAQSRSLHPATLGGRAEKVYY